MEVEEAEEGVTEEPFTAAERAELSKALAQSTASPLTRAIQAKNTNRRSHPDAALTREMEFRRLDPPPADLMVVEEGDDMTPAVRNATKYLHDQWADIAEVARNKEVSLGQLAKAGQNVLKHALEPLGNCEKELGVRIKDAQRAIDAVTMQRIDPMLASDIRKAFADKAKRGQGLDDIRRDVRVASAVLTAPSLVLDVDDERMGQYRTIAENAHAPDLLAKKARLEKLQVQTARAARLAIERLQPALLRWTAQQSEAMKRLMAS